MRPLSPTLFPNSVCSTQLDVSLCTYSLLCVHLCVSVRVCVCTSHDLLFEWCFLLPMSLCVRCCCRFWHAPVVCLSAPLGLCACRVVFPHWRVLPPFPTGRYPGRALGPALAGSVWSMATHLTLRQGRMFAVFGAVEVVCAAALGASMLLPLDLSKSHGARSAESPADGEGEPTVVHAVTE